MLSIPNKCAQTNDTKDSNDPVESLTGMISSAPSKKKSRKARMKLKKSGKDALIAPCYESNADITEGSRLKNKTLDSSVMPSIVDVNEDNNSGSLLIDSMSDISASKEKIDFLKVINSTNISEFESMSINENHFQLTLEEIEENQDNVGAGGEYETNPQSEAVDDDNTTTSNHISESNGTPSLNSSTQDICPMQDTKETTKPSSWAALAAASPAVSLMTKPTVKTSPVFTRTTPPPPPPPLPPSKQTPHREPLHPREFSLFCVQQLAERSPSNQSIIALPRGMVNVRNNCFCHVVLQALLALPPLLRLLYALASRDVTPLSAGGDGAHNARMLFWAEFAALGRSMLPSTNLVGPVGPTGGSKGATGRPSVQRSTPRPLLVDEVMPSLLETFRLQCDAGMDRSTGYTSSRTTERQQDAMEFLTFLLNALHEEAEATAEGVGGMGTSTGVDRGDPSEKGEGEEGWQEAGARRVCLDQTSRRDASRALTSTAISRLFHGSLRSQLTTHRKRVPASVTFQRFHALTLEVAATQTQTQTQTSASTSLRDALCLFFQNETLSDQRASKRVTLETIPPLLVLQLNRFAYDVIRKKPLKVVRRVAYTHMLQLEESFLSADLMASMMVKSDSSAGVGADVGADVLPVYELRAVVLHHGGSTTGGHYTAMCKDTANVWRHFDDVSVTTLSATQVLDAQKEVYILFYRLQ